MWQQARLRWLLGFRATFAGLFLVAAVYLYLHPLPDLQLRLVGMVASLYLLLLLGQWRLLHTRVAASFQLGLYALTDLLLVTVLVFASGGAASPFAFVFGLIIVAMGSQAHALLTLTVSLATCAAYLCAAYLYAWRLDMLPLSAAATLGLLLQTSVFMLVGGVMAGIARRHERLWHERGSAVRRHRHLQLLHGRVLDAMHEGMLVLDDDLRVQDSNEAARHLLAGSTAIQGKAIKTLLDLPARLARYFDAREDGSEQVEWKGGERTCLLTATRLPAGDPAAAWLLTMVDISRVRLLEKRLAEQDKQAALGRMAAMVAHEVRNPLQTIAQAVDLLSPPETAPEDGEVRTIIREEIQRLKRVLDDVLHYAQPLQPNPVACDLPKLVETAVRQVDMEGRHGIQHASDCQRVQVDADHFRLVIDNLLRNAVAASPGAGSVRVRLAGVDDAWTLQVADRGKGIPEHVRRHLFEPFVTDRDGGIGLGLATVWQVCRANGWAIDVDSSRQGTTFTVRATPYAAQAHG